MGYEKKYKEALEKLRSLHDDYDTVSTLIDIKEELEHIFPELRESEDERVRKAILELVRQSSEVLDKQNQNNMIAWLEKQEGCEHIKKDWLEHIKQSWYREGFIDGKYSDVKGCTINDDVILKELIDFLENRTAKLQHDLTRYANWLKIKFTPKKHLE